MNFATAYGIYAENIWAVPAIFLASDIPFYVIENAPTVIQAQQANQETYRKETNKNPQIEYEVFGLGY